MLLPLFRWLDTPAWHYWLAGWSMLTLCALSAVLPRRPGGGWRQWNSPALFALSLLAMVLAFRWPGLTVNAQWLNPDESQMLSSALTYRHFGTLWGHVDGMSSGPLVSLPLLLPALFGLPIDYTTGRLMGLLFGVSVLVFLWLALRHVYGDRPARLLILPAACALAFTAYPEYVQYSSEQAPLAYCAGALWLLVTAFTPEGKLRSCGRLALAGFVLGSLIAAKLQLVPLGLLLGLAGLGWSAQSSAGPAAAQRRAVASLLGGTLAALAVLFVSLWWSGELRDFLLTHLLSNFRYAAARDYPWGAAPSAVWLLAEQDPMFVAYAGPGLLLLAGLAGWSCLAPGARRLTALAVALLAGGAYAIVAPGRLSPHYLLIAIPCLALLAGSIYGGLLTSARLTDKSRFIIGVLFAGVAIVPQVWARAATPNLFIGKAYFERAPARWPVSVYVRAHTRPGDTMAIWGWMPRFYVETGLPQATREAHTQREITPHFLQEYLFARYLEDLRRNRPAVFLDAVGPGSYLYEDRAAQGHEVYPALREFLAAGYVQAAELGFTRVYLRHDRVPRPAPP